MGLSCIIECFAVSLASAYNVHSCDNKSVSNIEWINHKVLLYSTGNTVQYSVISHNGKETESHCYITAIASTL